jgi:hypothetical protein
MDPFALSVTDELVVSFTLPHAFGSVIGIDICISIRWVGRVLGGLVEGDGEIGDGDVIGDEYGIELEFGYVIESQSGCELKIGSALNMGCRSRCIGVGDNVDPCCALCVGPWVWVRLCYTIIVYFYLHIHVHTRTDPNLLLLYSPSSC